MDNFSRSLRVLRAFLPESAFWKLAVIYLPARARSLSLLWVRGLSSEARAQAAVQIVGFII